MSVESTSITTSRWARRASPEATTATSTRCRAASSASAVRSVEVSVPDTSNSTAVTGYLASLKMRSMFPPVAVMLAAMAEVDPAVSGCPSTVTCERPVPRGSLSPVPEMISASMPIDSAQPCTVARSSPSDVLLCPPADPAVAPGAVTRAHSVMRPRVTSCSMSTTSTAKAARVSKSPAVMPGLSLPKILTRRVGVSAYEGGVAGDVVMVLLRYRCEGVSHLPGLISVRR